MCISSGRGGLEVERLLHKKCHCASADRSQHEAWTNLYGRIYRFKSIQDLEGVRKRCPPQEDQHIKKIHSFVCVCSDRHLGAVWLAVYLHMFKGKTQMHNLNFNYLYTVKKYIKKQLYPFSPYPSAQLLCHKKFSKLRVRLYANRPTL